ncbi:pentatricopeptide repeat-containing protein At5g47360-like [Miscanthus floridulus]|uniref:pentatricopeptide repeat-containing protein At5g47360-like n=1 Tax=Miscanthus floridulus TaxID=154761 RepID=UPI00345909C3
MPPRASLLLLRRLSTRPPHHDHPKVAALLGVLNSAPPSSTSLSHALSRAFPSPSDAFPLRRLPHLLPQLPSPLLSLRFLLWRLTSSSPLPSQHTLSSLAASLPDLSSSVPLLLSSSPRPLPLPHYSLLLNISAHAGLFPASLAVLRHMRSFGLVPGAACFHHALRAAGSTGDVSAVLEIMSGSGVCPTVPVIVVAVHKLASAGDFEVAYRLIDKMPEFGCVPNAVVYTAVLDGMCSSGNVDGALRLVEAMEGSEFGANCAPTVVTYTCLVKCLCGKGRAAEALAVLDRMAERGVMPNRVFMRTLVEGFCTEQRVVEAYDVVERVVGDGSVSSTQCYNVLLISLWKVGMEEEAEGLAQRMMMKGVQLTPLAGSSMARELCGRKRSLDACYWLELMEENGVLCDSDVYGSLLLGLCEEGHIHEASTLGRKVVDRGILIELSCADRLVELLNQYGDEELASHILGLRRRPEGLSF